MKFKLVKVLGEYVNIYLISNIFVSVQNESAYRVKIRLNDINKSVVYSKWVETREDAEQLMDETVEYLTKCSEETISSL